MLGTSWECHKVRDFALRPMGDFLLVLDLKGTGQDKAFVESMWGMKEHF